jgi:hypothetical protein
LGRLLSAMRSAQNPARWRVMSKTK